MPQFTRRAFLAGMAATLLVGRGSPAEGDAPPRLRGWRWHGGATSVAATRSAAGVPTYQTEPIRAPYPFNAVGPAWPRPLAGLRLRASTDGVTWTDWTPVTTHEIHGATPPPGQLYFGDIVFFPDARYLQAAADGPIDDLQLDLIDSTDGPEPSPFASRSALGVAVPIIARAEWGCDERLRFDSRGSEIWPPEFRVPEKVIVHHTATTNNEANTAAGVRAIYYYHAISRGWGDIGYNFLVDWKGNVFEGRFGGRGIEAGHAYGHNPGSIGIACLGTFSQQTITAAMRQSLTRLIAQQARWLDPHDGGWFHDGDMPNLMGHRDAMRYRPADATSCPGNSLYALLPAIRNEVLSNLDERPAPAATIVDVRYEQDRLLPPSTLRAIVTIKNTGTATLATQGPTARLAYAESDTYDKLGLTGRVGLWRVGLDVGGGGAATDYPFRWGLPEALEPGKTATVEGLVSLSAAGRRECRVGLVREWRYWYVRDANRANLTVVDPATLVRRTVLPAVSTRGGV